LNDHGREHTTVLPSKRAAMGLAMALASLAFAAASAGAADDATQQLYKTKCQACHLAEGNSPIKEMNFADGEWIHGSKLTDVIKVIEEGVPGKAMLPFKEQLSKEEIEALAKFVRTFDKKLAAEKGAKGGK
jgi:mono/diheme cytochrome c family protein